MDASRGIATTVLSPKTLAKFAVKFVGAAIGGFTLSLLVLSTIEKNEIRSPVRLPQTAAVIETNHFEEKNTIAKTSEAELQKPVAVRSQKKQKSIVAKTVKKVRTVSRANKEALAFSKIEEEFEASHHVSPLNELALQIVDTSHNNAAIAFEEPRKAEIVKVADGTAHEIARTIRQERLALEVDDSHTQVSLEVTQGSPKKHTQTLLASAGAATPKMAAPRPEPEPAPSTDKPTTALLVSTSKQSRVKIEEQPTPNDQPLHTPNFAPQEETVSKDLSPKESAEMGQRLAHLSMSNQNGFRIVSSPVQIEPTSGSRGDTLGDSQEIPVQRSERVLFETTAAKHLMVMNPPRQPASTSERTALDTSSESAAVDRKINDRSPAIVPHIDDDAEKFSTENEIDPEIPAQTSEVVRVHPEPETFSVDLPESQPTTTEETEPLEERPSFGPLIAANEPEQTEEHETVINKGERSQSPPAQKDSDGSGNGFAGDDTKNHGFANTGIEKPVIVTEVTLFNEPVRAVKSATVGLLGYDRTELTTDAGRALFSNLTPAGDWIFEIKAPGYWSTFQSVDAAKSNDRVEELKMFSEKTVMNLARSVNVDIDPSLAIVIGKLESPEATDRAEVAIEMLGAVQAEGPFYVLPAGIPTRSSLRTSTMGMYIYFNVDPAMVALTPKGGFSPVSVDLQSGHLHYVQHSRAKPQTKMIRLGDTIAMHPRGLESFKSNGDVALKIIGQSSENRGQLSTPLSISGDFAKPVTLRVVAQKFLPLWVHFDSKLFSSESRWSSIPMVPMNLWERWLKSSQVVHESGKGHLLISMDRSGASGSFVSVQDIGFSRGMPPIKYFDDMGSISSQQNGMSAESRTAIVFNLTQGEKIVSLRDESGLVIMTKKVQVGRGWVTWVNL